MGADPVCQTLGPGGLGIGVVGGAQRGHEDVCLTHLAGRRVDNLGTHPGIIHKQLLTGPMHLAHDEVQLAGPGPVLPAEPSVLIAVRVSLAILVPQ